MKTFIGIDLAKPNTADTSCMVLAVMVFTKVHILDTYIIKATSYPERDIEIKDKCLSWELMYSTGEPFQILR